VDQERRRIFETLAVFTTKTSGQDRG
jgi:hypothetical protein